MPYDGSEIDKIPQPLASDLTVEQIAQEYQETVAALGGLEPLQTAAEFGRLLALPGFQANCLRLEVLVHLSVAYCHGKAVPTAQFIRNSFDGLGKGHCGRMEDPAEDMFVSLVNTPRGNLRIFEGIREGAGFHLQRILDIIEGMPDREPFNRIRDCVEALLKLSEAVAARLGVRANSLGQEIPLAKMPKAIVDQLGTGTRLLRFEETDLRRLRLSIELLADFVFNFEEASRLRAQTVGHTDLERRPLARHDACLHLLLPTAISSAITRMLIEYVVSRGLAANFERALGNAYGQLFSETSILGKWLPGPIEFQKILGGAMVGAMTEVDPGRFLHLVFFVDALDDFLRDGLNGMNADPKSLGAFLAWHIERAASEARKNMSFQDGITLFVNCGFGRALTFELEDGVPDRWRLEWIGAHNLITLSRLRNFDSLSLWRLLDSREKIAELSTELLNVNGLLNLVAWSMELGGHLVPHDELPPGFTSIHEGKGVVVVRQNAIRRLRASVMADWEPHRVVDLDGRWVKVSKLDRSEFEEERVAPLYGSEDDARGADFAQSS